MSKKPPYFEYYTLTLESIDSNLTEGEFDIVRGGRVVALFANVTGSVMGEPLDSLGIQLSDDQGRKIHEDITPASICANPKSTFPGFRINRDVEDSKKWPVKVQCINPSAAGLDRIQLTLVVEVRP